MSNPRKRVLIITYYWPPAGGSGVQRWLKFVKYLRDFGWEPIVYTPSNPEMPARDPSLEKDLPEGLQTISTEIWEPYDAYKKIIGRKKEEGIGAAFVSEKKRSSWKENLAVWVRGNFFIPDARKFWIKPSVRFLTRWLSENHVDAIASTGPPHSMHMIAAGVKKKFPQLPWIADFRDPWTNIDFYDELHLTWFADRKHHRLERRVLNMADAVVSVGETMSSDFRESMNGQTSPDKFSVISNGYDHEDVYQGEAQPDQKFSIAHIGTLNRSRNPNELWQVLHELVQSNPDFARDLEIKLVGKIDFSVTDALEKFQLTSFVHKIDYLPLKEVSKVQKQSRVLLLLINRSRNAKGILTGKFFEYMATGNPVLAIGPTDGDAAAIVRETQCGKISDFDDTKHLKANIEWMYAAYRENKTLVAGTAIEQYSRRELTRKLAALLDRLTA